MTRRDPDDLLRYLHGLVKKHGTDVELVVKVETRSGKVRRRKGRFLGLRGDSYMGLSVEPTGADAWYELEKVHDVWKKGSPPPAT